MMILAENDFVNAQVGDTYRITPSAPLMEITSVVVTPDGGRDFESKLVGPALSPTWREEKLKGANVTRMMNP